MVFTIVKPRKWFTLGQIIKRAKIYCHKHLSLKVPNVEFDFDVCVDNLTLGFDINAVIRQNLMMSPFNSVQMRPKVFDVCVWIDFDIRF